MPTPSNSHALRAVDAVDVSDAVQTTWPTGFPAAAIAVSGSAVRHVEAEPDAVFAWVRRVDLHEHYYPQMQRVRRRRGSWPQLEHGTAFSLMLGALAVPYVRVTQLDERRRALSWSMNTLLLKVCHTFTVTPAAGGGALLRSEEAAAGPIARAIAPVLRRPLQKIQDDWANALTRALADHPAGPPADARA